MATVAQVPLPSERAQAGPTGPVSVNAPAEAFGANVVGEGLEKLGQTSQQVSDQLAQRAQQLQGLTNKAHADDASSGYMVDGYSQLDRFREELPAAIAKGSDPIALAHEFSTSLESQRQKTAVGLGNLAAQDMFNQDSRRVQAYIVSQANSAALTGQKDFIVKSNTSAVKAQQQLIGDNFANPYQIMAGAMAIRQHYAAIGTTLGWTFDEEDFQTRVAVSAALKPVILHTAASNAIAADKMVTEYGDKKLLLPEDEAALHGALLNPVKAQGAAQISNALIGNVSLAPSGGGVGLSPASVSQAFPGATMTSGLRSPEHNAAVGGVANSHHLEGTTAAPGAMDFVPPKGMSMGDFATNLSLQFPGHAILNEGDHVHITATSGGHAIAMGAASANPITTLEARLPSILQHADQQSAAFAAAHNIDPDEMKQAVEAKVESEYNRVKFAYVGQNAATQSNLLALIEGGPDGSGPQVNSADQLFTFPGAVDAYKQLQPQQQQALGRAMNANANEYSTPRILNRAELVGKMQDPAGFAATDLSKYDLTRNDYKFFLGKQQEAVAKGQLQTVMDKEATAALHSPSAVAAASRLGWTVDNPDYLRFSGALAGEVEARHAHNPGGKLSTKDYDQMVANLFANGGKFAGVPNDDLAKRISTLYSQSNGGKAIAPRQLAEAYYHLKGR